MAASKPGLPVQICLRFDPPPAHLDTPRQVLLLRLGDTPKGDPWGVDRIAAHLGISPYYVRKYIRDAKNQLR